MVSALQTIIIVSVGNTFIVNCQLSIVNYLLDISPIKGNSATKRRSAVGRTFFIILFPHGSRQRGWMCLLL